MMNILNKCKFSRRFSSMSYICVSAVNSCGIITLNRPTHLNVFNLPMIREITAGLNELMVSPMISHIILEGSGSKAFCAGGDVKYVLEEKSRNPSTSQHFFRQEYRLEYLTSCLSKPVIAFVNGITMGGGVGISIHCRFRVASEKTRFAMPEAKIGLFTDAGGSYFLPRLKPDGLGLYLGLTGEQLVGHDNVCSGFATHIIPHQDIPRVKDRLYNLQFSDPKMVDFFIGQLLGSFHDREAASLPPSFQTYLPLIKRIYGANGVGKRGTMEDLICMLQSAISETFVGDTERKWLESQLDILNKASPTSLKVILRLLQLGRHLSLEDAFRIEYRLSQRFCDTNDFAEGVRAALIDKDHKPVWIPATLSDVTEASVDHLFSPLSTDEEWSK